MKPASSALSMESVQAVTAAEIENFMLRFHVNGVLTREIQRDLMVERSDLLTHQVYESMLSQKQGDLVTLFCMMAQKLMGTTVKLTSSRAKNSMTVNFEGKRDFRSVRFAQFSIPTSQVTRGREYCALLIISSCFPHFLRCLVALAKTSESWNMPPSSPSRQPNPEIKELVDANFAALLGRRPPEAEGLPQIFSIFPRELPALNDSIEFLLHKTFQSFYDMLNKMFQANYSKVLKLTPLRGPEEYTNRFELLGSDLAVEIVISPCEKIENREFVSLTFIKKFLPKLYLHLLQTRGIQNANFAAPLPPRPIASPKAPSEAPPPPKTSPASPDPPGLLMSLIDPAQFWENVRTFQNAKVFSVENDDWSAIISEDDCPAELQYSRDSNLRAFTDFFRARGLTFSYEILTSPEYFEIQFRAKDDSETLVANSVVSVACPSLATAIFVAEAKFVENEFKKAFPMFIRLPAVLSLENYLPKHSPFLFQRLQARKSEPAKEFLKLLARESGKPLELSNIQSSPAQGVFVFLFKLEDSPLIKGVIQARDQALAIECMFDAVYAEFLRVAALSPV